MSEVVNFELEHSEFKGYCFFEVVSKCLNSLRKGSSEQYSVKQLKTDCLKYSTQNSWIKNAILQRAKAYNINTDNEKDNDVWQIYMLALKYDILEMSEMGKSENKLDKIIYNTMAKENIKNFCLDALCGQLDIEGRILSDVYNVKILLANSNDDTDDDQTIYLTRTGLSHYEKFTKNENSKQNNLKKHSTKGNKSKIATNLVNDLDKLKITSLEKAAGDAKMSLLKDSSDSDTASDSESDNNISVTDNTNNDKDNVAEHTLKSKKKRLRNKNKKSDSKKLVENDMNIKCNLEESEKTKPSKNTKKLQNVIENNIEMESQKYFEKYEKSYVRQERSKNKLNSFSKSTSSINLLDTESQRNEMPTKSTKKKAVKNSTNRSLEKSMIHVNEKTPEATIFSNSDSMKSPSYRLSIHNYMPPQPTAQPVYSQQWSLAPQQSALQQWQPQQWSPQQLPWPLHGSTQQVQPAQWASHHLQTQQIPTLYPHPHLPPPPPPLPLQQPQRFHFKPNSQQNPQRFSRPYPKKFTSNTSQAAQPQPLPTLYPHPDPPPSPPPPPRFSHSNKTKIIPNISQHTALEQKTWKPSKASSMSKNLKESDTSKSSEMSKTSLSSQASTSSKSTKTLDELIKAKVSEATKRTKKGCRSESKVTQIIKVKTSKESKDGSKSNILLIEL